ncbi:MAG TPA: M48 family metallopeptidase [Desulfobacterales bacterium]
MNWIGWLILATLLVDYFLNLLADWLNVRHMQARLPEEFRGYYDDDRYRTAQQYLHVNTRFGWVVSSVNLAALLAFWFGNGFAFLDAWVRAWHLGPILAGMAYIGILSALTAILSLPFRLYRTFVIEARFGFNRTTPKIFIQDQLKALGLAIVLGAPLLAAVLWFFQYAGAQAWLLCWLAVTAYMLFVQFIAPTWIMPLFNKFSRLEDGELRDAIVSYARSIHFPLENIFVMDGSRRSSKSNAFFTGFGSHKRIVLFDTLIANHTVSELVAVLAHEMGHYKKRHVLIGLVAGILQTGLMFYLLSIFIEYAPLFEAFFLQRPSVYAGLVFFALLYTPLDLFLGMIMQVLSRRHEYQADRFAVRTTGRAGAMAEALKKLSVHNLGNLTPHPFYVFLNYSHPPVLARIRAIDRAGASQGSAD